MKLLKRVSCCVMAGILLLFCGCSLIGKSISGAIQPGGSSPAVTGTITPATASLEVSGSVTGAEPSDLPASPEASDDSYQMGSINGGTYTNEFIGIGCELDSNWSFYTDEQILELNGLVADSIKDENISNMLKSNGIIYDMYASADGGYVTINIIFENLGVLYGTILDESSYIDTALGTFEAALTSAGYSELSYEKTTTQFAGSERNCISLVCKYGDLDVYEELICVKCGSYMAVITLASISANIIPDMEALFYSVD